MRRRRYSREQLRESMRTQANMSRATADEMAAMYDGCDDPLWPTMPLAPQVFRDWTEFHRRVIVPLMTIDNDRDPRLQEAMRLYRQCNPHYIAACFYFAARSTRPVEDR